MFYLEVLSVVLGHRERSAWVHLGGLHQERICLQEEGTVAFEVSPPPSSSIVGSAHYSLVMERKALGFFFWDDGELSQPTGPQKQKIFRIGKMAKSTI